jgi:hypothetical protein
LQKLIEQRVFTMPDIIPSPNSAAIDQWQIPFGSDASLPGAETMHDAYIDAIVAADEPRMTVEQVHGAYVNTPAAQETAKASPIREGAAPANTVEVGGAEQPLVNAVDTGRKFTYLHDSKAVLNATQDVANVFAGAAEQTAEQARAAHTQEATLHAHANTANVIAMRDGALGRRGDYDLAA